MISAYSLILAAMTVTGGRMGDIFGRKRMFIIGAITFVAGAVIASMAHSFGVLLLGESIVEGIGAAMMMPATASLLVACYKGHDRALAFGIWGAVAAAATAIGPIVGGFLTTHYSWRWGFRINVVVVAILLIGSPLVKDDREPEKKQIDWLGVFLSSIGLFLVVFGIIESESYGWITARKPFPYVQPGPLSISIVSLAAGIVIVALFAVWEWRFEARGGHPVVSMRLFANRQFVSGAGVTGVMMLAQNGVIFTLPVFLQSVRNLDALHTGLMVFPMSLMILVVSPSAAQLTKRIPHKRLVQAGLICNTIAIVLLRYSISVDMKLAWLIPGLAVYGVGLGLVLSQINNLTLSAVDVKSAGEASGVTNTFRQVGISLGTAIIGAILISTILGGLEGGVMRSGNVPRETKTHISQLLVANSAELAFGTSGMFNQLPPKVRPEMDQLRRVSTTAGVRRAFLWCAFITILALGVSTFLPLRPEGQR